MKRTRSDEIDDLLTQTTSEHERDRAGALRRLCPCHVKRDNARVWERVFEMTRDPSSRVRYQAVHTLADGSPRHLEERVLSTLRTMWNDEDDKLRRQVRKLLNKYQRAGTINVL